MSASCGFIRLAQQQAHTPPRVPPTACQPPENPERLPLASIESTTVRFRGCSAPSEGHHGRTCRVAIDTGTGRGGDTFRARFVGPSIVGATIDDFCNGQYMASALLVDDGPEPFQFEVFFEALNFAVHRTSRRRDTFERGIGLGASTMWPNAPACGLATPRASSVLPFYPVHGLARRRASGCTVSPPCASHFTEGRNKPWPAHLCSIQHKHVHGRRAPAWPMGAKALPGRVTSMRCGPCGTPAASGGRFCVGPVRLRSARIQRRAGSELRLKTSARSGWQEHQSQHSVRACQRRACETKSHPHECPQWL